MSEKAILWKHILPNAILPLITLLGMSIGWLLGGVAVIETVLLGQVWGEWQCMLLLCVIIH